MESRVGLSVGTLIKLLMVLLGVLLGASCLQAQSLPWNIAVDSSFRVEFLFGAQAVRDAGREGTTAAGAGHDLFQNDWYFRLPVLTGTVEVSPLTFLSGRLAGLTSVLERAGQVNRSSDAFDSTLQMPTEPLQLLNAKPSFSGWEAAGLYHLWNDGGYRFSVTAGYRQDFWHLEGKGVGASSANSSSRDDISSYGPFLGLQTAVFFPWWKARFEVLGSSLMTKKISGSLTQPDVLTEYAGRANRGGLLEVQIEGTMYVTRCLFAGLHGRYTFQESHGEFIRTNSNGVINALDIYMNDSSFMVGLDFTLAF